MSIFVISYSIPVNLEDSKAEDLRNDTKPPPLPSLTLRHMFPSHFLDSRKTSQLFRPFYSHFHVHLVVQVPNSPLRAPKALTDVSLVITVSSRLGKEDAICGGGGGSRTKEIMLYSLAEWSVVFLKQLHFL